MARNETLQMNTSTASNSTLKWLRRLVLCSALFSIHASAQVVANGPASVVAKVNGFGTYGNGTSFIYFDRAIVDCSDDTTYNSRFDILPSNPGAKTLLANAALAMALDKEVRVHPGQCNGDLVIWTNDPSSYMILNAQ